ncbi:hypothetical protein N0V83_007311 [Neocucurbitaria cava]|uniref:SMP-30/Gluconolactonase/LRE-like region domain-containing protein n=1 Tax=Neocucurbitaria cava TaxID=798079 RepID=A0A9W9CK38_9PLEO|nr:hypothetical protein N0V83_007311 [Neocucurbitaria cava]
MLKASVLPYHFNRTVSVLGKEFDFRNLTVPSDPSFALLRNASLIVFDRTRGFEALGSNPNLEFMFSLVDTVHEAPVYVPEQNLLYFSELPPFPLVGPPSAWLRNFVLDLNHEPPVLANFTPNPPVFAPNGGSYRHGQLLWSSSGGFNASVLNGTESRISLNTIDPVTHESKVILNNFFGFYFNNIDDIAVHPITGDIFFTDPYYPWTNARSDTAPQIPAATYRFVPETGALFLVDDTLEQPNGLAFTPDGTTLYITDSGALSGSIDPAQPAGTKSYHTTGKRSIYAFDVSHNGTRVSNKRSFYLAQDYIPDGLKVSQEGIVLAASGHGMDIIDPSGQLLVRIQTQHGVANCQFTGKDLKTMWLLGNQGISRVNLNITGQTPK